MGNKHYIGIDIGGTNISAALVTAEGELSCQKKIPTPRHTEANEFIGVLEGLVDNILSEAKIKAKKLKGIGIGVPGLVDPKTGTIIVAPNLSIADMDIQGTLKKKYKINVVLGNDVNLGVLGEKWHGAAKGAANVVGIFPGTGIGGGIIINHKLILGEHGAAAELGHIIVDRNGPQCTCGNIGCIEAIAGRWAIERDIRAALATGEASMIHDLTHGDTSVIRSKIISKALAENDALVTRIMTHAANQLGALCVSLRHAFDPELFVFGGGLTEACGDFFLPIINEALAKDPLFKHLKPCVAVKAELGDAAIVVGAVALAMTQKKQKSKEKPVEADMETKPKKQKNKVKPEPEFLLSLNEKNEPMINDKKYKNDVCINGRGEIIKLKKYVTKTDGTYTFTLKDMEHLSLNDVKLIVLGEQENTRFRLTDEDEAWLTEKNIKVAKLPIHEAIDLYHQSAERKSIVLTLP